MSRGTDRHEPGLDALRAAVRGMQAAEAGRAARAGLTARDLAEPGRARPGRISGRSGRLRAGSVPEPRTVTGAPADPPESLALVTRAQAGDAQAFAELYDRYVDMVYRYVLLKVGNVATAEDLTSETFLRALRGLDGFSWQGRDVGAWFITIARHLAVDHFRSAKHRLELVTEDVAATKDAPQVAGPEDEVLAGLDSAALLAAVRKLVPEQQECIELRFLQGLTVAETAQTMGKNDTSVRALQYRAVRTLGRLLPDRAAL